MGPHPSSGSCFLSSLHTRVYALFLPSNNKRHRNAHFPRCPYTRSACLTLRELLTSTCVEELFSPHSWLREQRPAGQCPVPRTFGIALENSSMSDAVTPAAPRPSTLGQGWEGRRAAVVINLTSVPGGLLVTDVSNVSAKGQLCHPQNTGMCTVPLATAPGHGPHRARPILSMLLALLPLASRDISLQLRCGPRTADSLSVIQRTQRKHREIAVQG